MDNTNIKIKTTLMKHYYNLTNKEVKYIITFFDDENCFTLPNTAIIESLQRKGLLEDSDTLRFTPTGYDVARSFFIFKNGIDAFLPSHLPILYIGR